MIVIRNFFLKLSIVICTIIVAGGLLILSTALGYLDKPIKEIIEFYLDKQNYLDKKNSTIKIGNLQVRRNIVTIDKIIMNLANNTKGEIANLKINFRIKDILTNPIITNIISMDNLMIISEDNQPIITTKVAATQIIELAKNNITTEIQLSPIKSLTVRDSYGNNLPEGQGVCFHKDRFSKIAEKVPEKLLECKFTFSDQASLMFNSIAKDNVIKATFNVNNIPIMFYKLGEKFLANNSVIQFLQEYIKDGYIRKGALELNLDQNSLGNDIPKTAIQGNFHVVDLEYKYDQDFPAIQKMDTNITIDGPKVNFIVNQAYSSNSLLSGLITFEWKGITSSHFTVKADAKGETKDLIDFISEENYQHIKQQGIDLKKITGQASSTIEIIIPLNPTSKNTYNISTIITGANLTAFNDNILLTNAKITGLFDGDKIALTGSGKINNNASNFTYQYNITDNPKDEYKSILKIKTPIIFNKQQFGIFKSIAGKNVLDFEYKIQNNGQSFITASSNLKNLDFYIDKISIHKKLGKEAKLTLSGKLDNDLYNNINFSLVGEDNLKIIGKVKTQNFNFTGKYEVNLSTISYLSTNLAGKLLLDKDNLNAEIYGRQLDLSNANMMHFLEKAEDSKNIHLQVNIEKVRLKNNIWFDDFNLQINCNKLKCFSGSLLSKIGTKTLKMLLTDKPDLEQWLISCDNAGALLKGIGMYNTMKSGTINLILETKRHEVKTGEIIPILDGTFHIQHFIVTDMSFLTRIVSFVSFPGFMSFILNNKDIMFTNMQGKFSYIGNTIKITDSSATGPFFDFTMKGIINTDKRQIKLKGNVIPSFFFVSNVITKIPVIGKIFSKVAPYSVELEYKE